MPSGKHYSHFWQQRQDEVAALRAGPRLGAFVKTKVRCPSTRSILATHWQFTERIVEGGGKAGCDDLSESRAAPVDQVNAAVAFGGGIFDKTA